jgi:uncharacterized protein
LEFEWDPRKAATNIGKHQVSFAEAATAFGDPFARIIADPRHSVEEERFVLLGLSRHHCLLAVMYADRGEAVRIISARKLHLVSGGIMKKTHAKRQVSRSVDRDEILPEYDFGRSSPNKYASRYAAGSAVVVLEPDVARAFPTSKEANEALRALAGIIRKHQRSRRSR